MAINIKDLQDIMLQNIREAERDDATVQEAKRAGAEIFGYKRDAAHDDIADAAAALPPPSWGHTYDGLAAKALQAPEHKPDPDRPAPIAAGGFHLGELERNGLYDRLKQDPTAGRGDARARPQPNHASASQAVASAPPVGPIGSGGVPFGLTKPAPAGLDERERLIWQIGFNAGKGDAPPAPQSVMLSWIADRIADAIIKLNNSQPRSPTRTEVIEAVAAALSQQKGDEAPEA